MANMNISGAINFGSLDASALGVLRDLFFPVGSLFVSRIDRSPASVIAGEWTKILDGGYLPTDLDGDIKSAGLFELIGGYGENIGFITPNTTIPKDGGVGDALFVNNNTVTGTATNSKLYYGKGLAVDLPTGISGLYIFERTA